MQFSLRTILLGMTLLACVLVAPRAVSGVCWSLLPGVLITLAWPTRDPGIAFGRAALAAYVVLLQEEGASGASRVWYTYTWSHWPSIATTLFSGAVGAWLSRTRAAHQLRADSR